MWWRLIRDGIRDRDRDREGHTHTHTHREREREREKEKEGERERERQRQRQDTQAHLVGQVRGVAKTNDVRSALVLVLVLYVHHQSFSDRSG